MITSNDFTNYPVFDIRRQVLILLDYVHIGTHDLVLPITFVSSH